MDKNKKLNREFNEAYEAISNAYDVINAFYMNHCSTLNNDIDSGFVRHDIEDIWYNLSAIKESAHEIAEHFSWDQ